MYNKRKRFKKMHTYEFLFRKNCELVQFAENQKTKPIFSTVEISL